ncbi:MAG TPA: RNA polymerase subunit sigma-24 [Chthoniobacteraceae bacterium]|jgi:RNA polymerase sigma-70 factor (ECF subfamily)|nr:RNA polymerase subunit sigma-24 [Chthoniobacteraceae bacterium]
MKPPITPHSFQTTRWSRVRDAVSGDDPEARRALDALCEAYWYPIYAYIRRRGCGSHDAEDLTQGFFAHLLERGALAAADRGRGKLRNFLLACVNHYLADEHDRHLTQKRGAGLVTSLDLAWAEERYGTEPVDDLTPDRLYQRRWALMVLEHSLQLAREEMEQQGKGELFVALGSFLGFHPAPVERYEELAAKLGRPAGTLKNDVFRLRERWRKILFEQVALTLDQPDDRKVRDELAELLSCV